MPATAKAVFWNACRLINKIDELISFMEINNIPIALINETKTQKDIKVKQGYKVYQTNRPADHPNIKRTKKKTPNDEKGGGGTAIIINENIEHHQILLPKFNYLEATAIKVFIHNKPYIYVAAYNAPQSFIEEDFLKIFKHKCPIIVAGDLNSKHTSWFSQMNNANGKKLYALANKNNFVIQGPTTPTYVHHSGKTRPDILDIALVQNVPHTIEYTVHEELDSDHFPVVMKIHSTLQEVKKEDRRNFKKANWDGFKNNITSNIKKITSFNSPKDIDDAVSHLTKIIKNSIEENVPLYKPKTQQHTLPDSILKKINTRNKLLRYNRRRRNPLIRKDINDLRAEIEEDIKSKNNKKWNDTVSKLSTQDHSAWKVTKGLIRQPAKIPPLKVNDKYVCDPVQKVEVLATTLQGSFKNNPVSPENLDHKANVEENVKTKMSEPSNFKPKKYRPSQIKNLLRKLKKCKAPGPDEIPNEALINLPECAIKLLTAITNSILRIGYFPATWKLAKVLMIPKPGKNASDPNNYRPISLLCTLSKIVEKAILIRLNKFLNFKNIIRNEQFGFRSQHSTVQQVTRVTDKITEELNKNRSTAMLLIDLQKAFDRVWHDGLIYKLMQLNVPNYIVKILHSYLAGRSFYINLDGVKSSVKNIEAGVPQGSLLGPVLFNIFINDIPEDSKTSLAVYADDTAVYSSSFSSHVAFTNIQAHANKIAAWCKLWLLQVNASKCETILFYVKKRKHSINFNLKFDNEDVKQVKSAKYLGIYLDSKLTWKTHLDETCKKAYGRLGILYPLLNPRSTIQPSTALHIYKATILPIMTYASPVWSGVTHSRLKKLQLLQNKVLKIITKCPLYTRITKLHKDLKINMVNQTILELNRKFFQAASEHYNPLISNFSNYEYSSWDKVARPRDASRNPDSKRYYN